MCTGAGTACPLSYSAQQEGRVAMDSAVQGELVLEPRVNLTAMAEIVRDLLAGGVSRPQDGVWLRERAQAAGLDAQEGAALDALRALSMVTLICQRLT